MAPFRYDESPSAPLVGSIADVMMRGGDIRAQAAIETARINSAAQAQRGALIGQVVNQLGQMPMQFAEQRRANQIAQSQAQMRNMQMLQIGQQLGEHADAVKQKNLFETSMRELYPKYQTADADGNPTGAVNYEGLANELQQRGVQTDLIQAWLGKRNAFDKATADREELAVKGRNRITAELSRLGWVSPTADNFEANMRKSVAEGKVPPQTAHALYQSLNEQRDNYDAWREDVKSVNLEVQKHFLEMGRIEAQTAKDLADSKKAPTVSAELQKVYAFAGVPPGTPLTDAQFQAYEQREGAEKAKQALDAYKAQRDYAVQHPLNEEKTTNAKTTRGVLAQQVVDGNLSPSNLSKRGDFNDILADASVLYKEQTGKSLSIDKLQLDYLAAQKFVGAMNSDRRVAYRGLATSVVNTIDEVKKLGDELKQGGLAAWNKATRNTIRSVYGNTPQSELANRYIVAVNTLKEEFANLANGGYAPTEAAWKLANDQINGDFGFKDLRASLSEVQRLVNYRTSALIDQQPVTIGGPNAPNTPNTNGNAPKTKTFNPATGKLE